MADSTSDLERRLAELEREVVAQAQAKAQAQEQAQAQAQADMQAEAQAATRAEPNEWARMRSAEDEVTQAEGWGGSQDPSGNGKTPGNETPPGGSFAQAAADAVGKAAAKAAGEAAKKAGTSALSAAKEVVSYVVGKIKGSPDVQEQDPQHVAGTALILVGLIIAVIVILRMLLRMLTFGVRLLVPVAIALGLLYAGTRMLKK